MQPVGFCFCGRGVGGHGERVLEHLATVTEIRYRDCLCSTVDRDHVVVNIVNVCIGQQVTLTFTPRLIRWGSFGMYIAIGMVSPRGRGEWHE